MVWESRTWSAFPEGRGKAEPGTGNTEGGQAEDAAAGCSLCFPILISLGEGWLCVCLCWGWWVPCCRGLPPKHPRLSFALCLNPVAAAQPLICIRCINRITRTATEDRANCAHQWIRGKRSSRWHKPRCCCCSWSLGHEHSGVGGLSPEGCALPALSAPLNVTLTVNTMLMANGTRWVQLLDPEGVFCSIPCCLNSVTLPCAAGKTSNICHELAELLAEMPAGTGQGSCCCSAQQDHKNRGF